MAYYTTWPLPLSYMLVYFVSTTFFWPLVAAVVLSWCPLAVSALVTLLYFILSYRGSPEKSCGRPWYGLNKFWVVCHNYFPVTLRVWDGKEFSSIPNQSHVTVIPKQHIIALHPHGPFPLSASLIMPQLSKFGAQIGDIFQNVRFAAASAVFWPPLVRDMYLFLGCIEAGRSTLDHALSNSCSVAILPGGEREQLLCCPPESAYEDIVVPRDGLFRLALRHGTPILPSFGFGERRAYSASHFMEEFRQRLVRKYRIGIPCAWGRHLWLPFVPRPVAVTIFVGAPITVPQIEENDPRSTQKLNQAISDLRKRYCSAVKDIFDTHKAECGSATKELRWIEQASHKSKNR